MGLSGVFVALSIYYFIIFMGNTVWMSYIGVYYASLNLAYWQIGMIGGAGSLVSLLVQPLWGAAADRSNRKNAILQLVLVCTSASLWLIPASGSTFALLLPAVMLVSVFAAPTGSMADSIALELSAHHKFKFSTVRTVGSLGFALMSPVAGAIFNIDIRLLFLVFTILRMSAFVNLFFIPAVPGKDSGAKKKGLFQLFKDRRLTLLYGYSFLLSVTAGFFHSFHSIYSKGLGMGMDFIGIGIMIGSISQFPFMLGFDRLRKRFGMLNLVLLAGVLYTIRWVLYLFAANPVVFIIVWVIHGGTFILLYLCLSYYVAENVDPALKTRGQVMVSLVLFGVTGIVGSSLGGAFAEIAGLGGSFAASAVLCGLASFGLLAVSRLTTVFDKPEAAPLE